MGVDEDAERVMVDLVLLELSVPVDVDVGIKLVEFVEAIDVADAVSRTVEVIDKAVDEAIDAVVDGEGAEEDEFILVGISKFDNPGDILLFGYPSIKFGPLRYYLSRF